MLTIRNVNKYMLSPHQHIVWLFCDMGSLEGSIKTIIGEKLGLVFLSNIVYSIQWQASHGNWPYMHAMLINQHLFE